MSLVVSDLSVSLSRRPVLDRVDLQAEPGEVVAIVGPNGAGKSTLLRTIVGLVRPDAGRVTWAGRDLHALPPRERARRVGLVAQSSPLDHPFTVREVVMMGRYAHIVPLGGGHAEDRAAVDAALTRFGLTPLQDRPVTQLSGGERQRVATARVVAQDPRLFLFDEPTANQDLGQAAAVGRLLRELAGAGRAVVTVVHDLEAASRIADRMVLLAHGSVLAAGSPSDVLTPARLAEAFGVAVDVTWDAVGARVHVRT